MTTAIDPPCVPTGDAGDERPRERLRSRGPEALSSQELIALVLGTGSGGREVGQIARDLVDAAGGLGPLARASPIELAHVRGVGDARAARLTAAFELGRRALARTAAPARIAGPADVAARLGPRFHGVMQEIFVVLALDARQRVVEEIEIGRGLLDGALVHPREVFRPLVRRGAHAAVLAHNHPSGDPTPSREDVDVTRRLCAVGDLIGIPIVDHIVVADGDFTSIAELTGLERFP